MATSLPDTMPRAGQLILCLEMAIRCIKNLTNGHAIVKRYGADPVQYPLVNVRIVIIRHHRKMIHAVFPVRNLKYRFRCHGNLRFGEH